MPLSRMVLLGFCLVLLFTGCSLSPLYLANRPAIARCLPDGIHMDDFVEKDAFGLKITVGMKLARLGAHPGPDGKLYDLSGRRIEILGRRFGGIPQSLPPEIQEEADQYREKLKKTCTVIELGYDPDLPPPM